MDRVTGEYFHRSSSQSRLTSRMLSQLQISSIHNNHSYSHKQSSRSTTPNSLLFDQSVLRIKENQESQCQLLDSLVRENLELKKVSAGQVAQTRIELDAALSEIAQLKSEHSIATRRLFLEISTGEQEIIRLNTRLTDESAQKSKVLLIIDELSKQNEALRDEIKTAELSGSSERKELENKIVEMNAAQTRMNSKLLELEIERNDLHSKLINFNFKNERAGNSDLLQLLEKISTENSLLKNEVFDLTLLLTERNRMIISHEQALSSKLSTINALNSTIASLKGSNLPQQPQTQKQLELQSATQEEKQGRIDSNNSKQIAAALISPPKEQNLLLLDEFNQTRVTADKNQSLKEEKKTGKCPNEDTFMASFENTSFSFQNRENMPNNKNGIADFGRSDASQSGRNSEVNIGFAESQISQVSGVPSEGVPKYDDTQETFSDDEFKDVINPLSDSEKPPQ